MFLKFPLFRSTLLSRSAFSTRIYASADEAVADMPDGSVIASGGFGLCGIPENLIAALKRKGVRDLTIMSNNVGLKDFGIGLLMHDKQIRRCVSSFVGSNKYVEEQYLAGEMELEITP